jgi:peptidoglycan/xylan/chitin deacetylase (PgdA/CDA1 family)
MKESIKEKVKYIVAKISKYTFMTKLFYKLNKERKIIIGYHNVIPDKNFENYINLDFSIRESQFIKHLEVIKKRFDIGIDLNNGNEVTLTFDDGYSNQYSIASKILDEYNVNGYFFCAADLLDNKDMLLIDKIQYWIDYADDGKYTNEEYNLELELADKITRKKQWRKVQSLIKNKVSFEKICELLDNMFRFEDIEIDNEFYKLRFNSIKKSELERMKLKGHKIGAHSSAHNILSYMKSDELNKDIEKCRVLLETGIYNTKTFCYPFGGEEDVSDEVIRVINKKGFVNAIAFINKKLKYRNYNELFMPRMILPNTYDKDYIEFILSGAYYFMKNFKLLPNPDPTKKSHINQ